MILVNEDGTYHFFLQLNEHYFEGVFDDSSLSKKQLSGAKGVCLGSFIWKEAADDMQEYAEAF